MLSLIDNIISFLISRDWIITNDGEKFVELKPPQEFQLPEDYHIYVPKSLDKSDSNRYIDNLLEIVGDFYSLTIDDLDILIKKESSIFKVRVYDEETEEGKIPLNRFEQLIENIRAILRDTASFVIHKDIFGEKAPTEVSRYLNLCNFMQTQKGSFVANIQLPSKEIIQDQNLFQQEIGSEEINEKLLNVLSFVNKQVLKENIDITDEYIIENQENINLKLYKDIENLLEKAQIKNIDYSFHNISKSVTLNTNNITKEKIYELNQFVERVKTQIEKNGNFTVRGQITALMSKDPDGLKNKVTYVGLLDNMVVTAVAYLSSNDYKEAIEAHKLKKYISVSGYGKKTKASIRFLTISDFVVED